MVGNKSVEELLNDMNAAQYREYIPVLVCMVIMLVVGLVGNTLACVFYWRDAKQSSAKRLILALAAIDGVVCLNMVFSIIFIRQVYLLDNSAFCKIAFFTTHALAFASIFGVLSVVVFRYRVICKSHGTRLTLKHSNITVGLYCLFSVVQAMPKLLIGDTVSVNITVSRNVTITGHECKFVNHGWKLILNTVLDFLDITIIGGGLLLLFILYICIARTVWLNKKRRASFTARKKAKDIVDEASNDADCSSETVRRMGADANTDDGPAATDPTRGTNAKMTGVIPKLPCSSMGSANNHHKFEIRTGTLDSRKESSYTMMTFVISIAFVVSWLPYLLVTIGTPYYDNGATWVRFTERSFLINNVIDPIIYGYYNSHFRNWVWTIFKKMIPFRKL